MRRRRQRGLTRLVLAAELVLVTSTSPAFGGTFDESGVFAFDPAAVVKLDFSSFAAGDAGSGSGKLEKDETALAAGSVLVVKLAGEGFPIPLDLPKQGSYRLTYWMRGDCTGGAAVDYDDGSVGVDSRAFPTGRVTSDGWVEMQTQPFSVDGAKSGVDARMYLAAYRADKPSTVRIDAVEVVSAGGFAPTKTCSGLDAAEACSSGEKCVGGLCLDARGWFPPLPPDDEKAKIINYWKQRLGQTFGPFELRKTTLPSALATLDLMAEAKDNVEYWSRFTEAIRRLRDAHTYARVEAALGPSVPHPLNACFFEGLADASQVAAPSSPGLPDILVSHTGSGGTWGLLQGDRLVAVDGEHPLLWAKKLMTPSLWYWEADDPDQIANILSALRDLVARHASSITVVHCNAGAASCDTTAETIQIAGLGPSDAPEHLVGCDNRPLFSVDGAPADHDFGDALVTPAKVIQGPVLGSTPEEKIWGVIWNSLFGDGKKMPVDTELKAAVGHFAESRGALLDHREGHGGTAQTANILVSFARTPYTPLVGYVRTRADDAGPVDAQAAAQLFQHYKTKYDQFGSSSAQTDVPLALLLTWDVSASDFLAKILQGGPKVRLFGPGPSMGAFGTFVQYSHWGVMRWSVAIEDSVAPDGTWLTTRGVDPDEVVLPKQSDLLAGKDTVHEAAMAWLRKELAP